MVAALAFSGYRSVLYQQYSYLLQVLIALYPRRRRRGYLHLHV